MKVVACRRFGKGHLRFFLIGVSRPVSNQRFWSAQTEQEGRRRGRRRAREGWRDGVGVRDYWRGGAGTEIIIEMGRESEITGEVGRGQRLL